MSAEKIGIVFISNEKFVFGLCKSDGPLSGSTDLTTGITEVDDLYAFEDLAACKQIFTSSGEFSDYVKERGWNVPVVVYECDTSECLIAFVQGYLKSFEEKQ